MPFLRRLAVFVIGGALLLAVAVILYKHFVDKAERDERMSQAQIGVRVRTISATLAPLERSLIIIGEARPYADVTLYAKVSGYLRDILVDRGDVVKQDQPIAHIESAEIDKEYAGAKAEADNKSSIAHRTQSLLQKQLISAQEAEQAQTDARVAESKRDSLSVLKSYETLRAPFDGVVTARFADKGALVQTGSNSQPLVRISNLDRLRVQITLDQKDAGFVRVGDAVSISGDENATPIKGTISRVSGQLDASTRTLLAEIDVDNKKRVLMPGSFVRVSLKTKMPRLIELPAEALVYQQHKTQVAIVHQNVLTYRDVTVYSNDGQSVLISSGLKEGEQVAINVGSTLNDNSRVQVIAPQR